MAAITKTDSASILTVDSFIDLEAEMCRYNCHTKEELEEVLQRDYNTLLVLNFKYKDL